MSYGRKMCLGCRALGSWDSSGRCDECKTAHKAKYRDADYVAGRRVWSARLAAGELVLCPRCELPIVGRFDLGHQLDGTLHPEHPRCNRGARPARQRSVLGVVLP